MTGEVLFRWRLAFIVAFFGLAFAVALVLAQHTELGADTVLLETLARLVSLRTAFLISGSACLVAFLLRLTGEARLGSVVYGQSANKRVVTGGPFRFSRHPLYVGTWLFYAAVFAPYLPPLVLGALALLFAWALARIAAYEEQALFAEHGEAWTAYAQAVPRFLGWPRAVPSDGIAPSAKAWLLAFAGNLGFFSLGVYRVVVGVNAEVRGLGALNLACVVLWLLVIVGRRLFTR